MWSWARWATSVAGRAVGWALPRGWGPAGVDALGGVLTACVAVGRAVSAAGTVRWDPLGRAAAPIRVAAARGGEPRAFTVRADTPREQRVVAWLYRWHDAPDDEDWRACLARFGLAAPPRHTLQPLPGEPVAVAITLGAPPARGRRALERGGRRVEGPTPLGGLGPARLLRDAARA